MIKRQLRVCAAIACVLPSIAQAHHGLDFILVQTAHLPSPDAGYMFTRLNRLSDDESETEIEPGMLYGVTDWMAVEVHAHYAKEGGEGFGYESFAPAFHFRLTPAGQPFSFGVSAEYAFAHDEDGADVTDVAATFGYERGGWLFGGNLLYEKAVGSSAEQGYALGIRRTLGGKHGVGFELKDSFEDEGESEMLVGYYGELSPTFSLNAGLGTKVDEGPDRTAHVTFIWQFR